MAEKDAAAEKENAEPTAEKQVVQAPEPKKPVLIMGLLAFNAVMMGAVAFILFQSHKIEKAKPKLSDVVETIHKEGAAGPVEEGDVVGKTVPLETFTVNLAGTRGAKYARVNMELEVDGPKVEEEIDKRKPQIRDIIIILLSSKTYDAVTTKEGKEFLRDEIRDTLNSFLVKGKIKKVYFTDFVVN